MALSFKQSLAYFWEQIGKQFARKDEISQPDWASFAEEPGYIENRTHYINLKKDTYLGEVGVGENILWADMSEIANFPFPAQMAFFRSTIADYSNVKNIIFEWNGKTYYSRALGGANNCFFGSVSPELEALFMEDGDGSEESLELIKAYKSLAISECPGFFGIQVDTSQSTLEITVLALVNPLDYKATLKIWSATGDGEVKKLDNIYLDENVVITNSEQSNIIAGPFLVPMDDPDAPEPSYLLLNPPIVGFENNKTYYITINNETFYSIPTRIEQEGQIAYFFGNFTGIDDAPEGVYSSPEANYYGAYILSNDWNMLMIIPRDGAEITETLTVTIAEGMPDNAWLARDKNGNIYWEEKTHGIVKGTGQVIVPVREYTPEELEGLMATQLPQLQEGARYSITLGTTTWETVCTTLTEDGIQAHILGDIYGIMNGQDGIVSNPPIIFIQLPQAIEGIYNMFEFDPDFNIGEVTSGETLRVGIVEGSSIKKLDSKYINWPEWFPETKVTNTEEKTIEVSLEPLSDLGEGIYATADFESIDWVDGAYYTLSADGFEQRVYCEFSPMDGDKGNTYYINFDISGIQSGAVFVSKKDGHAICIIDNGSTMSSPSFYRGIFSTFPFTELTIKKEEMYAKKLPHTAVKGTIPALQSGKGLNSVKMAGDWNYANGQNSFAIGRRANAGGDYSFAFGDGTWGEHSQKTRQGGASGQGSISINGGAAGGTRSLAFNSTYAEADNQFTIGKYNIPDTAEKYAFIIGNGTGAYSTNPDLDKTSNALTVNWNGNTWVKGSLFVGGTSETAGASKVATEAYVNGLIVPPTLESTAGKENAAGPIGKYASGTPGMNSFTWGVEALAAGSGSIAMGTSSTTSSSAHWGVAIGTYAASKGGGAVAIGQNVTASSENAVAIGHGATASSLHSVAIGNNLTSNHNNQVVLGTYNVSANYSLLLGNGSGSGRSNAFGVTSTGTGYFAGDLYVNGTGTSSTFSNAKKVATESYVDTKVAGLVDSAPTTLNTLNELAAALGDDPNFATTVATEIGKKADKTDLVALTEAEILEVCGVAAVAHISEVTW